MFDRPYKGNQANNPSASELVLLVHLDFYAPDFAEVEQEFIELVRSTGATITDIVHGKRRKPNPKFFAGSGKIDEIGTRALARGVTLIIFNHDLSPSQERNIEKKLSCRVMGRTGLILDIFARRARSYEGRLQVELAQLNYLSTRLIRGWTHLERQKGGIGLRGPGETQLETDRRLLNQRIKSLKNRLAKLQSQREQGRRSRRRAQVPVISLVGYTNAGKSTLFNKLTAAAAYADNRLFATLDPTLRRLKLADAKPVVIADTVGFIRDLPHDLVESFSSTLEETRDAELLFHVVDATAEDDALVHHVNDVLKQIGADKVPKLIIYNKIDRLNHGKARLDHDHNGRVSRVWLSAKTGEGLDLLRLVIRDYFA